MAKTRASAVKKRDGIKVVIKDNQLVEAKYMFNIWETRFFLTLITMIDKEDEDDKVYRIWFKDIKKNFKINSNKSYDLLREAAISLADKSVDIPTTGEEGYKRNTKRRLLQFVDYLEKGQVGESIVKEEYIDVAIDKEIQPFLLHVKKNFDPKITRYTRYDLRNAEKLKPYAVRIYELMKQFEHKGFRTIRVQDLKEMFLITDEYPRFSTFNQSVILPSIKAINKHTDITIPLDRIEKIKRGRKVDALRFVIVTKTAGQVDKIRKTAEPRDLFNMDVNDNQEAEKISEVKETSTDLLFSKFEEVVVKQFGVTPSVFIKILGSSAYNQEDIAQAIRITRRAKYQQEIKKNVAGFFLKALKEGFTDAKEEQQKQAREKLSEAEIKEELRQLKSEKSAAINKVIKKLTQHDPDLTQQAIQALNDAPMSKIVIEAEENRLERSLVIEDYRKNKMLRELVKGKIVELKKEDFAAIIDKFKKKKQKIQ